LLLGVEDLHRGSRHDDSDAAYNGSHLRSAHRLHSGKLLLRYVCLGTRHPLSYNGSTVEQKVSQKQQSKEGTITAPERTLQFLASVILFLVLLTLRMPMTAQSLLDGFDMTLKEHVSKS
jgi:hypothetical protein